MKTKININSKISELDLIVSEMDCGEKLVNVYRIFDNNIDVSGVILRKNGQFYRMLSKSKFYHDLIPILWCKLCGTRILRYLILMLLKLVCRANLYNNGV